MLDQKTLWCVLLAMTLTLGCASGETDSDGPDTLATSDLSRDVMTTSSGADAAEDTGADAVTSMLMLSSINPATGPMAGGTAVNVLGRGFETGAKVFFGQHEGVVGATTAARIDVTTAAAFLPGAVDVIVQNPSGEEVRLDDAFTYTESIVPTLDSCEITNADPVDAITGELSPVITSILEGVGVTDRSGRVTEVIGEVGYGADEDYFSYTFSPLNFNRDINGADGTPQMDEYRASMTIPAAGSYRYVTRFKLLGSDWIYCDLDRSDDTLFVAELGHIEVTDALPSGIDSCQLIAGANQVEAGGAITVEARVTDVGVTDDVGQGTRIQAQLGHGSVAADYEQFNYFPMAYARDDADSDEYTASLSLPTPGLVYYAARFQILGETEWRYCDLDGVVGDQAVDPSQLGEVTVLPPAVATIDFCQTTTLSIQGTPGVTSPVISGVVFDATSTPNAGQGAGVSAELAWGALGSDPTTWTDVATANYAGDVNAAPGDLARDLYTSTFTPSSAGDYGFVFRFKTAADADWTFCNTSGTDDGNAFDSSKVGTFTVTAIPVELPDHCRLEQPEIAGNAGAITVGDDVIVSAVVYEAGLTDLSDGDASIDAELLVGPEGIDPSSDPGAFTIISASHDDTVTGQDEDTYAALYTPGSPGREAYFFRFSVDGGDNWRYCDLDGSDESNAFEVFGGGLLESFGAGQAPDLIDYCNIWQPSISGNSSQTALVTIETYEAGVTDAGADGATALTVEAGFGERGHDPAITGAFTWRALAFKGPHWENVNNYEYEGDVYGALPSLGVYDVAVRIRRAGTTSWTYCDTLNTTMSYQHEAAAQMTIQ